MTKLKYQPDTCGKHVFIHPVFGCTAFAVLVLVLIIAGAGSLQAQVSVTGHVFAEIVEPTALSAKASNCHSIEAARGGDNSELVLAEVKLSGGISLNIDVAVSSLTPAAANGEVLLFDAFVCPGCTNDNPNHPFAEKLFTLKATPVENLSHKPEGTYTGVYSVVFMYN